MTLFYYLALLLVLGVANFACTVVILRELAAAGKKRPIFDLRLYVFKHLRTYRELTRAKQGRTGIAYYGYLGTFAAMVVAVILLLRSLAR